MFKRDAYISKIRPFIDKEQIKVLSGMRRTGKSFMLELIKEELLEQGINQSQIISMNFEQMKHANLLNDKSLHEEISRISIETNKKLYLFFDEIQEVANWEKAINSFRVDFPCDIYITGSNAKLMSGELATLIAGRYVTFTVYPLSYKEYLTVLEDDNRVEDGDPFAEYIRLGGMPGLINLIAEPDSAKDYLIDIFNSIILKDIIKRNNIRDVDLLERIVKYIIGDIGHIFSGTGISKYFKSENRIVAPETILNYIKACRDAFLLYGANRRDLIGKKVLKSNEKYYIADHGIREAIFGNNQANIDQVFENIIYLELLRRGYDITVGKIDKREIDFIGQRGTQKVYIQVCYLLNDNNTKKREFGVFATINDNYPKYVVSYDDFDMSQDGILHRNIKEFLLSSDW